MAPFSESSIFVPVFFDGTLPRYGFCRCVAWALGVVVPSAGLIGRGVATEYPSGFIPCPDITAVDARTNIVPAARDRVRPFPPALSVIGNLLAVLIADETIRSHIFAGVLCVVRDRSVSTSIKASEAIQFERDRVVSSI